MVKGATQIHRIFTKLWEKLTIFYTFSNFIILN